MLELKLPFGLFTLLILKYTRGAYGDEVFGPPQFCSEWLPIQSQSKILSTVEVSHGLGVVPAIVEVLVRSIEEPNKEFIFKAIGNGERDDDSSDPYGGVVYIYNEDKVRVLVPNRFNGNAGGGVIYTGDSPYWAGVNRQLSMQAEVKIRCWAPAKLPKMCYEVTGLPMRAGSTNLNDTYIELQHGLGQYPVRVNVRAKLAEGDVGWYSDAQGSILTNRLTMGIYWKTGGLKFGYNNKTIRIWTSSYTGEGLLFSRDDGWGNIVVYHQGSAQSGLVDAYAWCDFILPVMYNKVVPFGPSVVGEELEVDLPGFDTPSDNLFVSIMVQATDGPNNGYMFEGIGSAMTRTSNLGTPCAYGGLIYAYNSTTLRIWRPSHSFGAAVCLGHSMGQGTNAQASQGASLVIRIWMFYKMSVSEPYEPFIFLCSHFVLLKKNYGYNSSAIDVKDNVTLPMLCNNECRHLKSCVTFTLSGDRCSLFNTIDEELLYPEVGSQVWKLNSATVN